MNAFDTNFKHRIVAGNDGEFYNIIDTVNPSLDRAKSLADLIEVSCEHNNFDSFEPDTLWRTAQAIRLEINDAQTLINSYFEKIKTDKLIERLKSDMQSKE
jgi:16S rRNA C1402 N4-methylase RsmH